jgi:fumarate hydratase class II
VERDALGSVSIPAQRLWGTTTERSRRHFAIGDPGRWRWPREVIRAFALVKEAAADANGALGVLPRPVTRLIVRAAREVARGRLDDEFPLGVFQTGSGTHSNMNANEVIARRANQLAGRRSGRHAPVDPHDHVNRGQSSNDVFPTVMHLVALDGLDAVRDAVRALALALRAHARRWRSVPILGRTHLQDAVPLMLGDVVGAWAAQLEAGLVRLDACRPPLCELALGATAVGTGLNAHRRFGRRAIARLARLTGRRLRPARDPRAALASHDALEATSAALRGLAIALFKIANDIRLYASGPRGGLGELVLPAGEPGSSIMTGKVNPSQCEALTMAAIYVIGCDTAVAWANAQGPLQLNVYKPLLLHEVFEASRVLADACASFTRFAVRGMRPNRPRIAAHLRDSLMLATALTPHLGYDRTAQLAVTADREGRSLRDVALASGIVSAGDFDRWVDPRRLARPHAGR